MAFPPNSMYIQVRINILLTVIGVFRSSNIILLSSAPRDKSQGVIACIGTLNFIVVKPILHHRCRLYSEFCLLILPTFPISFQLVVLFAPAQCSTMTRAAVNLRHFFSRCSLRRHFLSKPATLLAAQPVSCALEGNRPFTSDAQRATSGAIAAFPFLSKMSPSEAAQMKSFGDVAENFLSSFRSVRVIRDMASFESEVYRQPAKPLAIFFAAKSNNMNMRILEEFAATAGTCSGMADFFVIDVDEVPRAAYHCGVSLPHGILSFMN